MLGAPLLLIGHLVLRVLDFASVLETELLAELNSACGAVFHALSACHAVLLFYSRDISRTGHVRSVEELGSTQRVAYLNVAVADREYLAFAVDVGDLVNETVVLGAL